VQSTLRSSVVGSRQNLSDRQDIDSYGSWSQQPVAHLLVATDLTQRSDRAIERSLELTDLLGAQLTLLHVVDEGLPRRLIKHRRREAQTLLQEHIRILLSSNVARDVSINVRTGDICAEIAREAIELGSDAIILGMSAVSAHRTD
jgi:universal stress protein E